MPRLLFATILATLLSLAVVGSALAAKPDREVLEPGDPFVIEDVCEFDVLVEDLKVGYAIMVWERPDGSTMIIAAGQWQIRLTNVDTGASLTTVISGPEFVHFNDGVSDIGTGRWLLFDIGHGMWLTSGRIDLTAGSITDILGTLRGHAVDVCATLG